MQDIVALTQEFFTGPTGIEVDIIVAPEQELRERIDNPGTGTRLDVSVLENFWVSQFAEPYVGGASRVVDLTPFA